MAAGQQARLAADTGVASLEVELEEAGATSWREEVEKRMERRAVTNLLVVCEPLTKMLVPLAPVSKVLLGWEPVAPMLVGWEPVTPSRGDSLTRLVGCALVLEVAVEVDVDDSGSTTLNAHPLNAHGDGRRSSM